MRLAHLTRIALLASLVVAGFQPAFLDAVLDRDATARALTNFPDRRDVGLSSFVRSVSERVPAGATVALVHHQTRRDSYSRALLRVRYLLPGRSVIPLIDSDGTRHPERIGSSDFVLVWGTRITGPGLEIVEEAGSGQLVRRVPVQ